MSKRRNLRVLISFALILILVMSSAAAAFACTSIYFGKETTENGSTINGRSEDWSWTQPKYYTVHEAETHAPGDMYVSDGIPGFTVPYPEQTYRYTYFMDHDGAGEEVYAQIGTNEVGLAVSSSVTLSGGQTAITGSGGVDRMVNTGLFEEDIPSIILMQCDTAREGAQLLIDVYTDNGAGGREGTYISDKNETWFVQAFSGHSAVAVKCPDDKVGFSPNMTANVDLTDKENYIATPNLFKTANQAGTAKVDDNGMFLVANSYANKPNSVSNRLWQGYNYLRGEEFANATEADYIDLYIEPREEKYSLYEALRLLAYRGEGTIRYGGSGTGNSAAIGADGSTEAHVIETRHNMPDELANLTWQCFVAPEFNVYIPIYNALVTDTWEANEDPAGVSINNYNSADPDNNTLRTILYELHFLSKGRDNTEGLTVGGLEARTKYGQGVKAFWEAYQKEFIAKQANIDSTMRTILAYDYDLACEKATEMTEHLQKEMLGYAKQMVAELRAYSLDDGGKAIYTPTALTEGKLPTYSFDAIGGTGLPAGDFQNPFFISENIGALDDPADADNYVMVLNKDGEQIIIPRSGFYDDNKVGAKVYDNSADYSVELMEGAKFTDVPDWAKEAVNFTFVRGVVKGVTDTKFNSNANITRQDFVTMLMRAMNADSVDLPVPDAKFADDASISGYAKDYVNAAKALGIATGSNNKFNPKASITRQEMFTFIYRAMETFGIMPSTINEKDPPASGAFSDYNQVSDFAKTAVDTLYNLDLVSGSGGKLTPKANTTRAQSAQIMANVIKFEIANY